MFYLLDWTVFWQLVAGQTKLDFPEGRTKKTATKKKPLDFFTHCAVHWHEALKQVALKHSGRKILILHAAMQKSGHRLHIRWSSDWDTNTPVVVFSISLLMNAQCLLAISHRHVFLVMTKACACTLRCWSSTWFSVRKCPYFRYSSSKEKNCSDRCLHVLPSYHCLWDESF